MRTVLIKTLSSALLLSNLVFAGCASDNTENDNSENQTTIGESESALLNDDEDRDLQSEMPDAHDEAALACGQWGTTCVPNVPNTCCPGTYCLLLGTGRNACCRSYGPGQTCN